MRNLAFVIAVAALAAVHAGAVAAQATAPPLNTGPAVGAAVKDSKGQSIGLIEKIVAAPDGRPRQVQVRHGGLLRTLPVDGLTPREGAYVTVLTKAEFEALPTSE